MALQVQKQIIVPFNYMLLILGLIMGFSSCDSCFVLTPHINTKVGLRGEGQDCDYSGHLFPSSLLLLLVSHAISCFVLAFVNVAAEHFIAHFHTCMTLSYVIQIMPLVFCDFMLPICMLELVLQLWMHFIKHTLCLSVSESIWH